MTRFTKIVATIGPATNSYEKMKVLAKNGMNVARLNFSHGTHETHGVTFDHIDRLNKEGHVVASLLDTKGPQIRTGDVNAPLPVKKGEKVLFTSKRSRADTGKVVEVTYQGFAKDVRSATHVLIDNGALEFSILSFTKHGVLTRAKDTGFIKSRRQVNLPGARISLPTFTKEDWGDISFGIKRNADFIAPSFIRTAKDVKDLRSFLSKNGSTAMILSKIETEQAVNHLDEIIEASDGIMIARGDLGAEIPFELVPGIQDEAVEKCIEAGKPVIVATHMLESMIERPMPTRAEASDIAHAAITKADATMLSGETAAGMYPVESIVAMSRVLVGTEQRRLNGAESIYYAQHPSAHPRNEQALAACVLAQNLQAAAIVVITKQGRTARAVSMHRPGIPILAFTESVGIRRQLALSWGISPFHIRLSADPAQTVEDAIALGLTEKAFKKKDRVIVVSDILDTKARAGKNHVMTVQIRTV